MTDELEIKDLHVSVDGKKILNGLNLKIKRGEVHALMGPNGSGKTTLSNVIMGNPKYVVESGQIILDGNDITKLKPNERAKAGLFLGFQHPIEISGVRVFNFLRTALSNIGKDVNVEEFEKGLAEKSKELGMDEAFMDRYLNEGFSGGEKKRSEVLQMLMLKPKIAILDEADSGVDVDALKIISEGINQLAGTSGILLITHYERILKHVKPDFVHIMIDGKIVKSGDSSLVQNVEKSGYDSFRGGA